MPLTLETHPSRTAAKRHCVSEREAIENEVSKMLSKYITKPSSITRYLYVVLVINKYG